MSFLSKVSATAARSARSHVSKHRCMSTELRNRLEELVPVKQAEMKELNATYGDCSLGETTVSQAIGGMRGIKSMIWETSLLDSGT